MQISLVACILLMYSIWPSMAMVLSMLLVVALPIMETSNLASSAASFVRTINPLAQTVLTHTSALAVNLVTTAVAWLGCAVPVVRETFNPAHLAVSWMHTTTSMAQSALAHICTPAINLISAVVAWLGCVVLIIMNLGSIAAEHLIHPAHQEQLAVLWAIVYALSMLYTGWVVSSSLQSVHALGADLIMVASNFWANAITTLISLLQSATALVGSGVLSELWSGTASQLHLLLTLLLLIPHIKVSHNLLCLGSLTMRSSCRHNDPCACFLNCPQQHCPAGKVEPDITLFCLCLAPVLACCIILDLSMLVSCRDFTNGLANPRGSMSWSPAILQRLLHQDGYHCC